VSGSTIQQDAFTLFAAHFERISSERPGLLLLVEWMKGERIWEKVEFSKVSGTFYTVTDAFVVVIA
jgi:hypothetical protein